MKNETVLVTGAAGSIGSALVRRIAQQKPKKIIAIDNNETVLFDLHEELPQIEMVLASVRDEKRLEHIFKKYKPTVVFHVAAYKHVIVLEQNPLEALQTNLGGVLNVGTVAVRYKVKRFVFISSDKAADPESVMGWTKKYGEKFSETFGSISKTKFVIVRFGMDHNLRPVNVNELLEGRVTGIVL